MVHVGDDGDIANLGHEILAFFSIVGSAHGCGLYLKPAGINDGNKNGCKCDLAALTLNSKRNYKCLRHLQSTTPFSRASPGMYMRMDTFQPTARGISKISGVESFETCGG
jgi:hypothetical protein